MRVKSHFFCNIYIYIWIYIYIYVCIHSSFYLCIWCGITGDDMKATSKLSSALDGTWVVADWCKILTWVTTMICEYFICEVLICSGIGFCVSAGLQLAAHVIGSCSARSGCSDRIEWRHQTDVTTNVASGLSWKIFLGKNLF